MRNLEKNKQTLYALRFKKLEEVRDTNGYLTGEKEVKYFPKQEFKASVSSAKGKVTVAIFGSDVKYDKTIVLSQKLFKSLKINDNTVFFIDKKPEYDANGNPLYDYRVSKIAETLNEVVIAVSKVDKK